MSKKRTRKQKLKATKRRKRLSTPVVPTDPAVQQDLSPLKLRLTQTKDEPVAEPNLFRYDKRLIYKDLIKSLLITILLFVLLGLIYLGIKYNQF